MRNRCRGFSLIEIMVVISIATVILAIGIPGYVRYNARLRLQSAAQLLADGIRQANAQARLNGDGVGFKDTIPSGPASQMYALYAVHNGYIASQPVAQVDLGTIPVGGVPVLQGGGMAGTGTGSGNAGNAGNAGSGTGSGGAQMMQSSGTSVAGVPIGAVMLIAGQSLVFAQDGSPLGLASTAPLSFQFSDGDSTYQVSLSSVGQVTMNEVTTPTSGALPAGP